MLFNSIDFLLFFPIVTVVFFLLPYKFRWCHLLVASCYFYMAFVPVYILILLFTIVIDYIAGIMIENATDKQRKPYLVMSIIANVGVLAFFKYYNFFAINVNDVFTVAGVHFRAPFLKILLPIGLSFHTFQAMSYTIEVYRRKQKAEKHFGIYALYVMFYPQLVAGPIERPQNVLHQFHEKQDFTYDNAVKGLRLMLWGLFKKIVIADRLSGITDQIFNDPHKYSGVALAIGAIFFSFQIFCDFSGYSDIALGSARVMGFKLMTNFNKPYHSRSISEFWKRWHISLSTWFRDYLYISLGGNRVSIPRTYFNMFIVFLVSGFWHGANWTFIVWGGLHGTFIVFAMLTSKYRKNFDDLTGISKVHWLNNTMNVVITFTLATYAWIFFRANNIQDGFFITAQLTKIPSEIMQVFKIHKIAFLHLPAIYQLKNCLYAILFLEVAHIVSIKYDFEHGFNKIPKLLRWSAYYAGIIGIFYFGIFEKHAFIYFQF